MNKLIALSKLATAYHYLINKPADYGDTLALEELDEKFGYIRRGLRIADLKPALKDAEGLNGRMPTHF